MPYYQVAIVAVVMLAVGLAVGFLVGNSGDTPQLPIQPHLAEHEPTPAAPPARESADTKAEPAPAPVPADDWETPAQGSAAEYTSESLRAWVRELNIESAPGTGRIWGRVTSDGQPIAGATIVVLTSEYDVERPRHPPPDANLEETIEHYARMSIMRAATTHSTTSDADGRYELTGLREDAYRLAVQADGYNFSAWYESYRQSSPGRYNIHPDAEVNIEGDPTGMLVLDVRLPDGSQPQSAHVRYVLDGRNRSSHWNPRLQFVRMPLGRVRFEVIVAGDNPLQSGEHVIDFQPGVRHQLTIKMRIVPTVHCIVETQFSEGPVRGIGVRLLAEPSGDPPLANYGDSMHVTSVGNRFSRTNLREGRYRVIVHTGSEVLAWKDFALGTEARTVTVRLAEPSADRFIRLRVLDPQSQPMAARVTAYVSHPRQTLSVFNSGDGEYWVTRVPAREVANEDWHFVLRISSETHGEKRVEHRQNAGSELVVQFDEPATARIQIVGLEEHLYTGDFRGTLTTVTASHGHTASLVRDGNTSTLTGGSLSPGSYTFRLQAGSNVVLEQRVEVASGDNHFSFVLPTLYPLYLTSEELGIRWLQFTSMDHQSYRSTVEVGERTRVGLLSPGRWLAVFGQRGMFIDIRGPTNVRLDLQPMTALLIAISEPDDPETRSLISRDGLRNWDIVIGVNGEEHDSAGALRSALVLASRQASFRLTVLREGRRHELTIDGPRFGALLNARNPQVLSLTPAPRG
jgi:hypothetical protein